MFRDAGRLVARVCKARVAAPAAPTLADHQALPCFHQITQHFASFGIKNDRAWWNRDRQVLGRAPCHIAARPALSIGRLEFRLVPERDQRIQGGPYFQDRVSAPAAVPAIRAAIGHIFFPAEMYNTIAALSRPYIDFCFVNEHNAPIIPLAAVVIYL